MRIRLILVRYAGLAGLVLLMGCDAMMTEVPTAGDDFTAPLDGMSNDLNGAFLVGDENFERAFTVAEGLGPIFNNISCEGCHPGDGRGTPEMGFFRFSRGSDLAVDIGGPQHQDKAIPGLRLEIIPNGVDLSFRMPPPVFGMGLIEAIPVETILANADPDDDDANGISGRANWVMPPDFVPVHHVGGGDQLQLGRFSRKAQVTSLIEQVAAAYQQDMGITNDFIPVENHHPQVAGGVALGDEVGDPEIPASTVLLTALYVRLLKPPARGNETAEVLRGEQLFDEIGCASCHVPMMRTGTSGIPELSEVDAHLYSDLLLHDMGPGLADNRPDGDADGSEWRTPPLWGTRLVGDFLNGEEFYLHDGRARSVSEAIGEHGGEAQGSSDAYTGLSTDDRQALIAFVESL
ncbi:MAG TPA: c-type cytochrome [Candidatus Latescibacteria bacterium]|nr:c-type cytochrome [Candidatus Latescibacterota bacterium]